MRGWVVLGWLAVGCTSASTDKPSDADTDAVDSAEPAEQYPELTSAGCGSEPHSYLPLTQMGQLVEHEPDTAWSLPAAGIRALVESAGAPDSINPDDFAYDVELHKVRYITQDRGEAVETTGYVALPVVDSPAELPVALWLHPTIGFGDECAPSTGSLEGAAFPVLWASQGYVVAAPDYIGMNGWGAPSEQMHPWVVSEPTALASLDSLRASVALTAELGTAATPDLDRVVAIGASQGGHAALMADLYTAAYAPEVTMLGVVAAIPVTDMVALAELAATTDSESTLGLAAGVVTAWDWWGRAADLSQVLEPAVADVLPDALMDACSDDFSSILPDVETAADIFTEDARDAAAEGVLGEWEPWGCYLRENSLLRQTVVAELPTTPKLIVTGTEDDLAWPGPVRADAEALCAAGVPVELHECEGLGHVDAAVDNLGLLINWSRARVAGEPMTECVLNEPAVCEG